VSADTSGSAKDPEFEAITAIVGALTPLDEEARLRVLDYSLRRLGLKAVGQTAEPLPPAGAIATTPGTPDRTITLHDIRSLTDDKKPKSAIEMAALVGFYLAHLAPEPDRKTDITAADITKYFHDANFPLPGTPSMTLVHAKNAGYFDAGSSKGSYKLNPVGHNLVAHRLPASTSAASGARVRGRRSTPKRRPRGTKIQAKSPSAKPRSRSRKSR
jgi:hypothetical protein